MNQMRIDPINPVLKEELYTIFNQEIPQLVHCREYESAIGVQFVEETKSVQLHFAIANFESIFSIAGDYLLKTYYSEFTRETPASPGFDLTISYCVSKLPHIPNVKKPTPEQVEEKKAQKAKWNSEVERLVDNLSRFRTNFLSSPFEFVFDSVKAGNSKAVKNFTFNSHLNERVWCLVDAESVTCFFGMSFADKVDRTIAKLLLDEFTESKRHVKNPPSITRVFEDQKFVYPQVLSEAFPELKGKNEVFLNGLISFTFFKDFHMKEETQSVSQYLGTFRQYVHFHVSASKSYLHGRLLKNIATNLKNLKFTKYEQEEERNFRSQRDELIAQKTNSTESSQAKTILKK